MRLLLGQRAAQRACTLLRRAARRLLLRRRVRRRLSELRPQRPLSGRVLCLRRLRRLGRCRRGSLRRVPRLVTARLSG